MGSIKRNALHMLNSQVVITLCQGLQFVLIARTLGAGEFGRLSAILAINSILVPFAGLGSHSMSTMRLAHGDSSASLCYGNSLFMGVLSGLALTVLAFFITPMFLGAISNPGIILLFGVSDCVLNFIVGASASVFMGLEQHRHAGRFQSTLAFSRMCCAVVFVGLFRAGIFSSWSALYPAIWGCFYLLGSFIAALLAYRNTVHLIGKPSLSVRQALHDVRTGIFFSIGVASMSVYTDIDKAILARVSSKEINGAYTAAYRVIAMSYAPVRAFLNAMQGRFFREGAQGLHAAVRSAIRVAVYSSAYCLIVGVVTQVFVPVIPMILGKSYALSGDILGKLAFLPLFIMLQEVFSAALTGAGRQHLRSLGQVIAAALCFVLNLNLAPRLSWIGAVVATYLTQMALTLMVIGVIWYLLRSDRRRGLPITVQEGTAL